MSTVIGADAAKLAGLQVDLLQKVRQGKISLEILEKFVRGELVEKNGAIVASLALGKVYDLLGMSEEYQKAQQEFDLVEDPNIWKLVVLKGLTCNKLVKAYKKAGVEMYLYENDLDKAVPTNDRDPKDGSYTVSFSRNVEADEDQKSLSADDLKKQGVNGITLLERLLLGLAYFLATGKHLDVDNVTLCSGSRDSGGGVPSVSWRSGVHRVCVHWYGPDGRGGDLRARSVVSVTAKQALPA